MGRGILAVGLGLLTGGLAFAALGAIGAASLAPIAAGLAFTVTTSLVLGGQQNELQETASTPERGPEDLNVNTTTEARPVPVIFGRVRIGGNIVRYDKRTFSNKPIYQKTEQTQQQASGGKGGLFGGGGSAPTPSDSDEKQIIGYHYKLSWDLAFCMGPVDSIQGLYTNPGERDLMADNPDTQGNSGVNPVVFGGSYAAQRDLDDGAEEYGFHGSVRYYKGSSDQVRYSTDDYAESYENHRHVCFLHFRRFNLGTSPAPRTTLLEVHRLPQALDAAGSAIAGFYTRGSTNSGVREYEDANPAACMFEILTNKVWGAGVPHDQIDTASFISCSAYFAANDIGLSFTLSQQDRMSEAINFLREHVQTLVLWNGEQVKLVCLMDRSNAYTTINRLTRDQVRDPEFSRPTWPSTVNEVRVNFVNRNRNHKTHTVVEQDLGSIQAVGRIQSRAIELPGFSTRRLAQRQARRFLIEAAYPSATFKFKMNRLHSGMEPGGFIQFVWPDWTDGDAITFWRIVEIADDQTDSGMLTIQCVEDPYAVSYEGTVETFSTPPAAFEDGDDIEDSDISVGDDHTVETIDEFGPGFVYEPEGVATGGNRTTLAAIQRFSGYAAFATWTWEIEDSDATNVLPGLAAWGIFGTLRSAVAVTRKTARNTVIEGTLLNEDDITDILTAASLIDDSADHYDDLLVTGNAYLIIGTEVMRVGWATDEDDGDVNFTSLLRGVMGTTVQAHSIDDQFVFIPELDAGYYFNAAGITTDEPIEFKADQVTIRGSIGDDTQIEFFGPEPDNSFIERSRRCPAPTLLSEVDASGTWTAYFRARVFTPIAIGTIDDLEESLATRRTTMPADYGFYVVGMSGAAGGGSEVAGQFYTLLDEFDSSAPADMPAGLDIDTFLWEQEELTSGGAKIKFVATPTAGVNSFRIYGFQDGRRSAEYVTIDP